MNIEKRIRKTERSKITLALHKEVREMLEKLKVKHETSVTKLLEAMTRDFYKREFEQKESA